jgi:hypothetical protein
MPDHFLYSVYAPMTEHERITTSIQGLESRTPNQPGMLDIARRCRSVMAWSSEACDCTVRFEDIVGPQGGGSRDNQIITLRRVARHLGVSVDDDAIAHIADNLFGGTLTFRKGEIGSWRQTLSAEHKRLFKQIAGDVLVKMGYERSLDW